MGRRDHLDRTLAFEDSSRATISWGGTIMKNAKFAIPLFCIALAAP
jgi:hypothetical protein